MYLCIDGHTVTLSKMGRMKTQIIRYILSKILKEMNNYHEPFLGGGSVLSLQKQGDIKIKNKIFAYDINHDLIDVYKHIQNNKKELYYIHEYDKIKGSVVNRKPKTMEEVKSSKESYWIRDNIIQWISVRWNVRRYLCF